MVDESNDKSELQAQANTETQHIPPELIGNLDALKELAEHLKADMQRIIELKKATSSKPKEQNMFTLNYNKKSDHSSVEFNQKKIELLGRYINLTQELELLFSNGSGSKQDVKDYLNEIVKIEEDNKVINDEAQSSNQSGPIIDLINHTYDKCLLILNYEPPRDSKEPSNPNQ